MKLSVNGVELTATVIDENGTQTGYAPVYQVMQTLRIPVRLGEAGELLIGVRRFAEVLEQEHRYLPDAHHFLIDTAPPVPDLPAEPVGASARPWVRITPVIASGPMDRSPGLLERCIRQFRVAENPRYRANQQGAGETYCNIYLRDVTQALGCEIPHVVNPQGERVELGHGQQQDANAMVRWMNQYGRGQGWKRVSDLLARLEANAGRPAVALWFAQDPPYIGHVAILRPAPADPVRGPAIAQAGARNFDDGHLADGFGSRGPVEYWVHD